MPRPRQRIRDPEYRMVPLRAYPTRFAGADIAVTCWCERRVLLVPLPLVRQGRTGSCGHRDCTETITASA